MVNLLVYLNNHGKLAIIQNKKEVALTWDTSLPADTVNKKLQEIGSQLESLNAWEKVEDCAQNGNQLIFTFKLTLHAQAFIQEYKSLLAKVTI